MRTLGWILLALVAGAAGLWFASAPRPLPAATLAALPEGDAARGETWFWAGGCASCHAAAGAKGDDRLKLGGGRMLATDFGRFSVPNISPDPADGIGSWTVGDFANALLRGVAPGGVNLYPAFPYPSYTRMRPEDVADLWAYLRTLPPVAGKAPPSALAFPYSIRRGVGLWKRAFLSDAPVVAVDTSDPKLARGQYLVEGPGHCGECHTPRNFAGALDLSRWLGGAPNPEGRAGSRTSRRRATSATGRSPTSSISSSRASPRTSIRSAARWSRCRRTSRCSTAATARRSPPT